MLHIFTFNTHRRYGPEGQAVDVKCGYDDDGERHLVFNDTTRGIVGRIPAWPSRLLDNQPLDIQTVVMAAYDHGLYDDIPTQEFFAVGDTV